MRWVRSWPAVIPPGRAYVVDDIDRLVIDGYDYSPLAAIDDDIILVEWDMAVSAEDRERFEASALLTPSCVHTAPYRLYDANRAPHWAHRTVLDMDGKERWVQTGEPTCDYFAFGLTYLPRDLIRRFMEYPAPERGRYPWIPEGDYTDTRFTDQTFSVWHYWRSQLGEGRKRQPPRVRVAWHVAPVHLHYPNPKEREGTTNGPNMRLFDMLIS